MDYRNNFLCSFCLAGFRRSSDSKATLDIKQIAFHILAAADLNDDGVALDNARISWHSCKDAPWFCVENMPPDVRPDFKGENPYLGHFQEYITFYGKMEAN